MAEPQRIQNLNDRPVRDRKFVLYWMQASQRAEYNQALEYAIERANELDKQPLVVFGLTENFPRAPLRPYHFMLEGLRETEKALAKRGILLIVRRGKPDEVVVDLAKNAALVIVDRAYTRTLKKWRRRAADALDVPLIQVESDVCVPVETASDKEEYAARTIRPRIHKHLLDFLVPVEQVEVRHPSTDEGIKGLDLDDIDSILDDMRLDTSVGPAPDFRGGTSEAKKRLDGFIDEKLDHFPDARNDPMADGQSNMSPYLHFGQISPIYIARRIIDAGSPGEDDYIEELVVRRELAINFVHYDPHYDSPECLPDWARETLREHESDERPYTYSEKEFREARTHDACWNAAQMEMVSTGKMHGYMRMYWGKKILEWSPTIDEAWQTALELNDRYELDGRDPNGYTGVAWCFGKHDQAWKERDVFGKVRYMNRNGLKRKFDTDAYIRRISDLCDRDLADE